MKRSYSSWAFLIALAVLGAVSFLYEEPDVRSQSATAVAVTHVTDGDTIKVQTSEGEEVVRLIGVNTPETVDPRRPVGCFGKEASNALTELLDGTFVILESDATQEQYDRYGRMLAYVYLPDGLLVNEWLIEQGYAHEYTYDVPYRFQAEFRRAEERARYAQRGLWDPAICPGE